MLLVAPVRENLRIVVTDEQEKIKGVEKLKIPRSVLPAITHVDYSARVQSVSRNTNSIFYDLIEAFGELTGHPVLVNTSFNVRGEPIVCTPAEAYNCFVRTGMDFLVMENLILDKAEQKTNLQGENPSWQDEFPLD